MILIYKPDGQEQQQWLVQLGKLRVMETEAIEKRTGLAYGTEFKAELLKGATRARRALLWTYLRREHPALRFEDVDFCDDELELQMDRDELAESRARLLATDDMDADIKVLTLAEIDRQLAEAPEPPGKAPVKSDA